MRPPQPKSEGRAAVVALSLAFAALSQGCGGDPSGQEATPVSCPAGTEAVAGLVQQNLPLAGVVPEVSEGTPPVVLTANELYAIPVGPAVPTGD